jgi:hypothetical protein
MNTAVSAADQGYAAVTAAKQVNTAAVTLL